jgi:O-antigen/teichoic acid export membrane protein
MGFANYLLGTTAARRFAPGDYSQLGAMLNLIAALSPISGAIGGAIIRRASMNRARDDVVGTDAVQRTLNRYLFLLHIVFILAAFVAHGAIARYLHLTTAAPLYLVAVTSLFAFMFGLLQGILQERGTYGRLSLILLGESLFRCVAGVAAILLGFGVTGVVFVYAISAALVIVVLPRPPSLWTGERAPWHITRPILRDVGQLALANVCVAALVNLDVVLCRHYLAPVSADRYVALAALAKVFLYATGSISSIAVCSRYRSA